MASYCITVLRLEGILQTWGIHSLWEERDTRIMPTKSGIVGILGAAMGIDREERGELSKLSKSFYLSVREDRPGVIFTDFQTVSTNCQRNAKGEVKYSKVSPATFLVHRDYIADAAFTAFLLSKPQISHKIKEALLHPVWLTSLGCRSSVPSRPIYEATLEVDETMDFSECVSSYPLASRPYDFKAGKESMVEERLCRIESEKVFFRTAFPKDVIHDELADEFANPPLEYLSRDIYCYQALCGTHA